MTGHVEQPMPILNDRPSIQGLVRADLDTREQVGIQRYGTPLQPHNGRDALRDAYEEALDLSCYLKQAIVERDTRSADIEATTEEVADVIDGAFLVTFSSLSPEPPRSIAEHLLKRYRITPRNEAT